MEWLPLLLVAVRIITPVEPGPQLRITEHLVRLVDVGHLFLRFLLWYSLSGRLVGVVLLRHLSVRAFDLQLVGVRGDVENFVVVFRLGSLQLDLCFLEKVGDLAGRGVVFLGEIQGLDGCFVIFSVQLAVGLGDQAIKRVGVEFESIGAVGLGFLLIVHLRYGVR